MVDAGGRTVLAVVFEVDPPERIVLRWPLTGSNSDDVLLEFRFTPIDPTTTKVELRTPDDPFRRAHRFDFHTQAGEALPALGRL